MTWTRLSSLALLCLAASSTQAVAQQTVFVVRHAERADATSGAPAMMATDPSLSEAGHARAASLATMLADAGISGIFVTEFKRTQETAAPLAKALAITPVTTPANDQAALVEKVKRATGNVLVVGHSNTVPAIVKALGVSSPITVADTEFDNLFIVTTQPPNLIRLRYR